MKNRKKIIFNIVFFLIAFPPAFVIWFLLISTICQWNIVISPQLSEKTVLSLSDNLSILEITGKSNFKNDKFHLKLYEGNEGSMLQNKAVAYIAYKGIFSETVDYSSKKFYYDIIDNCTRYYEISYNKESNKALCIDGKISRTNPFSAKIVKTNNQNTIF